MASISIYSLIVLIQLTKSQGSVGTLTTAQKQSLLDMHNEIRNLVASGNYQSNHGIQPTAADMNELLWDNGLAQLATDYSELCVFDHSDWNTDNLIQYESITSFQLPHYSAANYQKALGEHLAYSSLTPVEFNAIEAGVQGWIDEGLEYGYGAIPKPPFGDPNADETCTGTTCERFTQIIWDDTRYIGCGYSDCDGAPGSAYAMNLVCLYFPLGNWGFYTPYKSGPVCSDCDGDRTANCDANYQDALCAGGVDSSWHTDRSRGVDTCDNGLGQALPNAVCPTTAEPTTAQPTTSPTTSSPTTARPTTTSPTTASPTSASPTTARPTTSEPTTTSPTTSNPTAAADEEPETSTTVDIDTTLITDDAQQCPGLDLDIELFYTFNFNRIQRRCDLCLTEEEFPGQRRADRIERGCEAVGDFLNNITNEYSDCMLNICNYQCTLDRLTITQNADQQEICGCNIFECNSLAASANGYKLWSATIISLGIVFNFIFG